MQATRRTQSARCEFVIIVTLNFCGSGWRPPVVKYYLPPRNYSAIRKAIMTIHAVDLRILTILISCPRCSKEDRNMGRMRGLMDHDWLCHVLIKVSTVVHADVLEYLGRLQRTHTTAVVETSAGAKQDQFIGRNRSNSNEKTGNNGSNFGIFGCWCYHFYAYGWQARNGGWGTLRIQQGWKKFPRQYNLHCTSRLNLCHAVLLTNHSN